MVDSEHKNFRIAQNLVQMCFLFVDWGIYALHERHKTVGSVNWVDNESLNQDVSIMRWREIELIFLVFMVFPCLPESPFLPALVHICLTIL